MRNQLREQWSIVIRMSKIFPDVDVTLVTTRIVQHEDFRAGIFPIDQQELRNVLRERLSMKV